ncbi:MAG: hypothetical protein OXU68_10785 [Bacteroidota bacterium]|nr:hypothetical protein [Bacteroidota bacterium]MDE2957473.1 hypothetical protein [Bacteroidota bacterium]
MPTTVSLLRVFELLSEPRFQGQSAMVRQAHTEFGDLHARGHLLQAAWKALAH